MTTTLRRHSAALAGFVLLSLLVLAVSLETSRATTAAGAGVGSSRISYSSTSQVAAQTAALKHTQLDSVHAAVIPVTGVAVAAEEGVSTTTWVILAVVLGAVAIGSWILLRRMRRSRLATTEDAYCTLHPQDARCMAG